MNLKKLIGAYLVLSGIAMLLMGGGLLFPALAVVFFPVALLDMFVNSLGFGGIPLVGGLLLSYAGSVIAILIGLLLI